MQRKLLEQKNLSVKNRLIIASKQETNFPPQVYDSCVLYLNLQKNVKVLGSLHCNKLN